MINLIPNNARTLLLREYWLRVAAVWMLLAAIVSIVITLLLVPSYVLITLQRSAYGDLAAQALGRTEDYSLSAAAVTEANKRAEVLIRTKREPHEVTTLVYNLKALSGAGVEVNEVRITRASDGAIAPIVVTGVASMRAELAQFKNALEAEPEYTSVDLPISNLAKDIDIDFSVTITLSGTSESV